MTELQRPPSLRKKIGRLIRLTRKELRETLRDRRTVITLVLMPLLVYPLLSITFQKSLLSNLGKDTGTVYSIGVESERAGKILRFYLSQGARLIKEEQVAEDGRSSEKAPGSTAGDPPSEPDLQWLASPYLENHVANLDVQVAVRLEEQSGTVGDTPRPGQIHFTLLYRENSLTSNQTLRFIEERLRALNRAALRTRLRRLQASDQVPAELSRQPIAVDDNAPFSLATLVPLVLILMTITGAVYPAIDLTAGERERKTLETLMAAPVSRVALLLAKYVAVLTVATLTAIVNLVAMTVTIFSSGMGPLLFPEGLSFTVLSHILGLLILFAAFFSAVLLALTSFARSFKEAQAYLIPVMLLAISPGLLSLMPGIELNKILAITPLINIVLLGRDVLEGSIEPGLAALAIASTIGYAAAAITVASRIFGNDAVLYASRGSWSELFLRPAGKRAIPTISAAIACFVVMFPVYFLMANLGRGQASGVAPQLVFNALVTVVVFGGCPLLFAVGQRVRLASGFRLRGASIFALIGASTVGLALWPFAHEIFLFGKWIGITALHQDQFAATEQLILEFQGLPVALILVTLALVPAALEEFFFRGFLFSGLSDRFSGWRIVVVSAVLFGLFHVLTPSVLTPERFLPSTFLGFALGWVCLRSGSIFPGILLHACHNGLLLVLAIRPEILTKMGGDVQGLEHIPFTWLVAAGAITLVGCGIVMLGTRKTMP